VGFVVGGDVVGRSEGRVVGEIVGDFDGFLVTQLAAVMKLLN
jgi:hypothetical protein